MILGMCFGSASTRDELMGGISEARMASAAPVSKRREMSVETLWRR